MNIDLYFDGAAEPNPGTGSYGVVITGLRATPDRLRGVVPVTPATNNVAEWYALREGLDFIVRQIPNVDLAGANLMIRGDSKLVVNQLTEEWACRQAHLRAYLTECLGLTDKLTAAGCSWWAEWVPREQNADADALSTEAWSAATGRPFPHRHRQPH